MHTKDRLAAELEKAELPELAAKARDGYYDDFLSPLDTPALELAADLAKANTPLAYELRKRHLNGEFDSTREESDEWASSADGKDTMRRLLKGD